VTVPLDPAAVVADFIDRVSPYQPAPDDAPTAMLGVRTAAGEAVFAVSDHVVRALCQALEAYRDPEDRGRCADCGGRRLDANLHCLDCGRVQGIFGQVLADHARRMAGKGDLG
jgi:hypothetical protein